jgi:hypothetical protein
MNSTRLLVEIFTKTKFVVTKIPYHQSSVFLTFVFEVKGSALEWYFLLVYHHSHLHCLTGFLFSSVFVSVEVEVDASFLQCSLHHLDLDLDKQQAR